MVFSGEDKIFIKNLLLLKGYSNSSCRLIKEFTQKGWNKFGLDVGYCCERFEKRPAWIVSPAADDHVVWAELKQKVIDKAIEQWRSRLRGSLAFKRRDITSNILLNETLLFLLTLDSHAFHDKLLPNYNWLSFIEDFEKFLVCFLWGTVYNVRA